MRDRDCLVDGIVRMSERMVITESKSAAQFETAGAILRGILIPFDVILDHRRIFAVKHEDPFLESYPTSFVDEDRIGIEPELAEVLEPGRMDGARILVA